MSMRRRAWHNTAAVAVVAAALAAFGSASAGGGGGMPPGYPGGGNGGGQGGGCQNIMVALPLTGLYVVVDQHNHEVSRAHVDIWAPNASNNDISNHWEGDQPAGRYHVTEVDHVCQANGDYPAMVIGSAKVPNCFGGGGEVMAHVGFSSSGREIEMPKLIMNVWCPETPKPPLR